MENFIYCTVTVEVCILSSCKIQPVFLQNINSFPDNNFGPEIIYFKIWAPICKVNVVTRMLYYAICVTANVETYINIFVW